MKVKITGIAHYLPPKIVTNDDLSKEYDITEERIFEKTGIKSRNYLKNGCTADLVIKAIKELEKIVSIHNIDCLILGTNTPDTFFPSTASNIIKKLKIKGAYALDVDAACAGFSYGFHIGKSLILSGDAKKVLVCGGDKMSSTLNNHDYKTAVLFGDGAGVMMIESCDDNSLNTVEASQCYLRTTDVSEVYMSTGLHTKNKFVGEIKMLGRMVYESGVSEMTRVIKKFLQDKNLSYNDIDYIVPHQANLRMLEAVSSQMKMPMEKFLVNIENNGNTGAASIPICLSEFYNNKKLKKGDRLLIVGFGAGYSSGVIYLKWSI